MATTHLSREECTIFGYYRFLCLSLKCRDDIPSYFWEVKSRAERQRRHSIFAEVLKTVLNWFGWNLPSHATHLLVEVALLSAHWSEPYLSFDSIGSQLWFGWNLSPHATHWLATLWSGASTWSEPSLLTKTSFDPLGRDQSAFRLPALPGEGGGGGKRPVSREYPLPKLHLGIYSE